MSTYPLNVKYHGLLNGMPQLPFSDENVFDDFMEWVVKQRYVQFDVETPVEFDDEGEPVMGNMRQKTLITVQFGSVNQKVPVQWVFQWSSLTDEQKTFIKMILEDPMIEKIIQNAAFELQVCLNYGIRIRGIYDTMLIERLLWCGYSGAFTVKTSLEAISYRRLQFWMDKDLQTSFSDNIITNHKIAYAARDVRVLDMIKNLQLLELHQHDLEYVAALENESVIGFAQMMWEGMELDREKWLANIEWARPLVEEAEHKCDEWLTKEPFRSRAIALKYINTQDQVLINWNSNPQKRLVTQRLFPDAGGATKSILQKHMATMLRADATAEIMEVIWDLTESTDKKKVTEYLIKHHYDWCVEQELIRPAGTALINWNSVQQVLPLLQAVDPRLKDMSEDSMGKFSHPIGLDIEHFKERLKLISTYGEKFLKHVQFDNRVRTIFNQILTTGRVASSKPNMQNITVKDFVGLRYRNCFLPPKGFKFVSSDYVSQELVIIAYISQDKNWLEALRKKQDLHSVASELVFRDRKNPYHVSWKEIAEKDCAYYKQIRNTEGKLELAKQKCKCPKHKIMRDACKSINFGLAYGMTEYRLAAMLRISLSEARALIRDYFVAMPAIGKTMTRLGYFGLRNGFIQTLAPFFRKRWFPLWEERKKYIDEHLAGVRNDWVLSAIEKESKNQPIQGSSADCTKIAICMVMWELDEKKLHDTIQLVMQVHDQLDTVARDDHAEQWKPRLTEIMEEAALVIIPNGLLKAETSITDVWSK